MPRTARSGAPDQPKRKPLNRQKRPSKSLAPRPGRESLYNPETHDARAKRLALLGLKDSEIATAFGVTDSTIGLWKVKHPSFSDALNAGKVDADANVALGLYQRASGMTIKTQKATAKGVVVEVEEYLPPDVRAQQIWLYNRQPDRWRDRKHVEVSGGIEHQISLLPAAEREARLQALLAQAGQIIEGEAVEVASEDDPTEAEE